jgi:acetyl esterase/lipase
MATWPSRTCAAASSSARSATALRPRPTCQTACTTSKTLWPGVLRIILAGHSAGAILTAHVALRSDWLVARNLPLDLLKAAIPISGVYDFSDPTNHAEFFASDADRAVSSPLLNITAFPPSTVVAYGSRENGPKYGEDSRRVVDAIRARGGSAELLRLEPLDHADTVNALANEASPLLQSVAARFVSAPARA